MRLRAALGSRTERACGTSLYTTAAALADGFLTGIGGNGANRGVKTPGGKVKQILFGLLMANADALSAQYALAPVVQNGAGAGLRAVPLRWVAQSAQTDLLGVKLVEQAAAWIGRAAARQAS